MRWGRANYHLQIRGGIMTTWLHFIGNQYYSSDSFNKELHRLGFNRKVPLSVLRQMEINDIILFVQHRQTKKQLGSARLIAAGRITGVSTDCPIDEMLEQGLIEADFPGLPTVIERRCGRLVIAGSYELKTSLYEISNYIQNKQQEMDRKFNTFVKGVPIALSTIGLDEGIIFTTIPFRQGFRPVDLQAIQQALLFVKAQRNKPPYKLFGGFYADVKFHSEAQTGELEQIFSYERA